MFQTRRGASQCSPFFQHFGLIELGPMPTVAAVDLMVRSAPPHRPIPLDVARKAVEVLGGHPFYLQMFGERWTAKEPPYDSALLRQVFSEMLFSRTGRLSLYLTNELERTVGQAATLSAVLESLAERAKRLTEIAGDIGARAVRPLATSSAWATPWFTAPMGSMSWRTQ